LPFAFCLLVFLVAFGVRFLMWQDARDEAAQVQWAVTANYKHMARLLAEGGLTGFYSPSSTLADPDTLGHPPGYPLLLALVYGLFGAGDEAVRLAQIFADALAAVVTLLIAAEFVPRAAALLAGLLAALSPQFAWNSVLLLPDTLAVLPVLLAVWCVARALKRPRLAWLVAAGALVGISCWLRANALLLAPFLAAAVALLFERRVRLRYALALVAGAAAVVAPLTLRNAVVFGAFIPVSLGAGQTLLEGIADYDSGGRFGIPATDVGIQKMEAVEAGRPDYAATLFGPDAVARERARLARGLRVVGAHPVWFLSVMARRAASMLRLERTPRVSPRGWANPARAAVASAQRLFITAVVLPLAVAGLWLWWRGGERRALALLLVVPAYYLCVQSALHTEYRYFLAVPHFLFVLAATGLHGAAAILWRAGARRTTAAAAV
jgi:hypothetical protein